MFPESAPASHMDNHAWSSVPEFRPQYRAPYFNPFHIDAYVYNAIQSVRATDALQNAPQNAEVMNKLNEIANQLEEFKFAMAELKFSVAELSRERQIPEVSKQQPKTRSDLVADPSKSDPRSSLLDRSSTPRAMEVDNSKTQGGKSQSLEFRRAG
ncbi:hypothetical protein Micbo1qcDRAFT_49166 [Microdochium bolleyi]|uniref:Uncharacterized protein n=1 Tax=Microdochium bolleyi TaxID=196109 RepID=A0A136IKE8_9PEZI|nr:hypothetical protein Micbo1qcDRAFT_49166 [Microdochium bolleyi]